MTIIKRDTFNVDALTPADTHISDIGGSYQGTDVDRFDVYNSTPDYLAIDGAFLLSCIGTENPTEADQWAEIEGQLNGSSTNDRCGVMVRALGGSGHDLNGAVGDESECYFLRVNGDGDGTFSWILYKNIGGAPTQGGMSGTLTGSLANLGVGDTFKLKLEITGFDPATLVAYYDEDTGSGYGGYTELTTSVDSSATADQIAGPGNVGVYIRNQNAKVLYLNFEDFVTVGETINRVLTENTVVTDPIPGYQLTKERPANSNVTILADAMFLYYAYARLAFDYFDLPDAILIEQSLRRDLADAASLQDAVTILRSRSRALSNAIATSDGLVKSITIGDFSETIFRVRTDSLVVTDSVDAVFLGIYDREFADTLALGEYQFLERFLNRSLNDQLSIVADLMNFTVSKLKKDVVAMRDRIVAEQLRVLPVTLVDSLSLTDSLTRNLQYIKRKQLSDVFSVLDSKWFESGTTLEPAVKIETGITER